MGFESPWEMSAGLAGLMLVQGDGLGATASASSQVSRRRQDTAKPAGTAAGEIWDSGYGQEGD